MSTTLMCVLYEFILFHPAFVAEEDNNALCNMYNNDITILYNNDNNNNNNDDNNIRNIKYVQPHNLWIDKGARTRPLILRPLLSSCIETYDNVRYYISKT